MGEQYGDVVDSGMSPYDLAHEVEDEALNNAMDFKVVQADDAAFQTPVTTPRQSRTLDFDPPGAPRVAPMSPLLAALVRNDFEGVHEALERDPYAARTPFFDHGWEPPLCAAVRAGCDQAIVQLLVEQSADANARDVYGRSAVDLAFAVEHLEQGGHSAWSEVRECMGLLRETEAPAPARNIQTQRHPIVEDVIPASP